MITPAALSAFLQREARVAETEQAIAHRLSEEELVARGDVITGLIVTESERSTVTMRCDVNDSRLRPGDRVELRDRSSRHAARLLDVQDGGCTLLFEVQKSLGTKGPWTGRSVPIDLSQLLASCLSRLRPGAPGWALIRHLNGESRSSRTSLSGHDGHHRQIFEDLVTESGIAFDSSQLRAFERCLSAPSIFAVQGPPGTGKTGLLAHVAEAFARRGKRVLIVAPTHQAVNNALSTIRRNFPGRDLVKVGDELHTDSLSDGIRQGLIDDGARQSEHSASSATITGMTFLAALVHLVLRRSALAPNVLLVEEAAQLPLVQGACAGLIGAGSTLLFGDDAQMPPVFHSDVEDDPLATSLFAAHREACPNNVEMLTTSYRLNEELCRAIRDTFYRGSGGELRPSDSCRDRRFHLPKEPDGPPHSARPAFDPGASLVWIQTPSGGARQQNRAEATLAAWTIRTAIESGISPAAMAVVTPFRRQAGAIRSEIQRYPGTVSVPIVDTVERVQGLTVDLVLFSLCATDPTYVSEVAHFLFSPNRLNVALSRARTKSIFCACPNTLAQPLTTNRDRLGQAAYRAIAEHASLTIDLGSGSADTAS